MRQHILLMLIIASLLLAACGGALPHPLATPAAPAPTEAPAEPAATEACGSTTQVTYDRTEGVWERRENIAVKHKYEVAVNPFSGQKLTGDGHAPLVYAQDPRADVPAELQRHLVDAIKGSDDVIVSGWLQYGLGYR